MGPSGAKRRPPGGKKFSVFRNFLIMLFLSKISKRSNLRSFLTIQKIMLPYTIYMLLMSTRREINNAITKSEFFRLINEYLV